MRARTRSKAPACADEQTDEHARKPPPLCDCRGPISESPARNMMVRSQQS